MADAARICTFRIVQEAINNVIRHAEAAKVDVALEYADEAVRVVVRDVQPGTPAASPAAESSENDGAER